MKLHFILLSLIASFNVHAFDIFVTTIPYNDKTIDVVSMVNLSSSYQSKVSYSIDMKDPDMQDSTFCVAIGSVVVGTIENVLYLKNKYGVTIDSRTNGVRKLTLQTVMSDENDKNCAIKNRSFIGNASSGWVINEWFQDKAESSHAHVVVEFGAKSLAFAEDKFQGQNLINSDLLAYSLTSYYKDNRLEEDRSVKIPLKLKK